MADDMEVAEAGQCPLTGTEAGLVHSVTDTCTSGSRADSYSHQTPLQYPQLLATCISHNST